MGAGQWDGSGRPPPRLVAVAPVVVPLRSQLRGERQRPARLAVAAELLQRPPEAEQREVVRRRLVDDGLELGGRRLVARAAKQGPAESLANGRLVRLQIPGSRQRNGGRMEVAVLEQLRSALVEVVDV